MQQKNNLDWDKIFSVLVQELPLEALNAPEQAAYEELMVSGKNSDLSYALQGLDKDEAWEKVKDKITIRKEFVEKEKPRKLSNLWMAAASVVLIIGLSLYLIWGDSGTTSKENRVVYNDALPGSNKAVLVLADGSSLTLDSGGSKTVQLGDGLEALNSDGRLIYNLQLSKNVPLAYNKIITPKGGQYQVTLSDGTKVWLNAGSSLRFPTYFEGGKRIVELSGEGYFEVQSSKENPFVVLTGNVELQVLGTHFNVNAYSDEPHINTTLLEGSLKVSGGEKSVVLTPGEQALVNRDATASIQVSKVGVNEAIAWREGKFIFDNTDIYGIMRQLEKWYDIDVEYRIKSTEELFVGNISRNVNVSQILNMLEKTGTLKFEIIGKKVIVKQAKP